MRKHETLQDRNRRRTEQAERQVGAQTLIIPVRSLKEREYVRSHLWYSGASDDYIASFLRCLPLALNVLRRLRGNTRFALTREGGQYVLRTADPPETGATP